MLTDEQRTKVRAAVEEALAGGLEGHPMNGAAKILRELLNENDHLREALRQIAECEVSDARTLEQWGADVCQFASAAMDGTVEFDKPEPALDRYPSGYHQGIKEETCPTHEPDFDTGWTGTTSDGWKTSS